MIEAKVHMSSHNKAPFFSIVIPLYNCEQYISDCIESIINQTYKNFEIIVVDDGSTDNSYEICHNIQQKYSELHVFRQQNSGTYNARLNGIRQSKGRYFLFVDSDDMIREDTLEGSSGPDPGAGRKRAARRRQGLAAPINVFDRFVVRSARSRSFRA